MMANARVKLGRDQRELEKALRTALTEACETARSEVEGFAWVTHEADHHNFPASLQVVWVFDTQRQLAQALESGQGKRLYELTATALHAAGIAVGVVAAHVRFDSEEACRLVNGGNWQSRLDMLRSASP